MAENIIPLLYSQLIAQITLYNNTLMRYIENDHVPDIEKVSIGEIHQSFLQVATAHHKYLRSLNPDYLSKEG